MSIDYSSLWLLALTIMAFSIKPGPGMLAVASRAIGDKGLVSVTAFMAGNNLAKLIFLAFIALGYHYISDHALFIIILAKSLAAIYLMHLGIKGLFKTPEVSLERVTPNSKKLAEDFMAGFVITITNPYDIVVFAGIIPTIIPIEAIDFGHYWLLFFVMLLADIPVVLSYVLPLRFGRKFLPNDKLPLLDKGANIALIIVGLIIGFSALLSADIANL
tara:strand:- start:443 stop:1093 length:651 start_codon:yes stop_codon:yes gene_type:complete